MYYALLFVSFAKRGDRIMKGKMKRLIATTATAIMIMTIAVPVYAGTKYNATCASPGCDYERSDHSSYCRLHTCQETDCYSYRNNGSVYCDRHAREKLSDRKREVTEYSRLKALFRTHSTERKICD